MAEKKSTRRRRILTMCIIWCINPWIFLGEQSVQLCPYLLVLLMQDFCDVTLHSSELLIDAMQEVVQVSSVQQTALDQDLERKQKLMWGLMSCIINLRNNNNAVMWSKRNPRWTTISSPGELRGRWLMNTPKWWWRSWAWKAHRFQGQ